MQKLCVFSFRNIAVVLLAFIGAGTVSAAGGTFTAFGPKTYVRDTGAPVAVSNSFSVLNPSTTYTLKVANNGISSGVISINGVQIVGPDDFNQNVASIERPISLLASNQISVELRSAPGASISVQIIGVDNDPPVIMATVSPTPNAAGWNNTNVTVTFTCSDATSGVAICPPAQILTGDGANQVVSGTATDKAGNTASTSVTVKLDKTPPVITASAFPPANAANWNNTPVTVSFVCSDATSGIVNCPQSQIVSADGANQVISGTATDVAGNTAKASVTVNLDQAPPTITATVSPAPNAAGWNNTNPTVSFTCSDSLSGVTACPTPQTISSEGANQLIAGTATDVAGNAANTSVTIKLDKTPPTVAIASPPNGSTISLSTISIGLNGSEADNLSGVSTVTCNGSPAAISGSNFTCSVLLAQGANSISVQATDVAGNTSSSPLSLTFAPAPQLAITAPANLSVTNLSPVTVRGTVSDPAAVVTINGISAPQSSGIFAIPVPLTEGLNVLTAVATNSSGAVSTATAQITLDTTPPHITIDTPANGTIVTDPVVTVTGLANDIVVGTVNAQDVQVTVNGIAAQVANRTYAAANVPLAIGANTIQAVARDRAGNGTTSTVTVTRVLPSQPPAPAIGQAVVTQSLSVVSGNSQTGAIATQLPAPLVVALADSASHPLVNQTVVFKVIGSDGTVSADSSGTPSTAAAVSTDSNGQARVFWALSRRSGAGINAVQASSPLAVSPVNFTATGVTSNPATIVVDSGNDQVGVLAQPLGFPFVAAVVDAGHNRVPDVPVTFAVKQGDGSLAGARSQTVTTDSNGRAIVVLTLGTQIGSANNVVEATFPNNPGGPAAFAASARAPGNPANTTVSGVVFDNSNNPIQGATIRLFKTNQGNSNNLPVQVGTPVQTDAKGAFLIQPAPVGFFKLMADGTTASSANSYPTLEYDIVTVAGNDNTVGMPIYLPALDTVNRLCVDETHGGTLTLPQVSGFSLTVLPGSATFPGGSRTGCVSVTPVNGDKVPMAPGFGQQPRFIVTIQPVGTRFDPPAAITLPNVDGLKPKAVTEMYSYDHDLGMFVAIGTGTVSDDGSMIASNPGVGVLKAGWHCGGDPAANGTVADCPDCKICQNNACVADPNKNGSACQGSKVCCNGNCVQPTVDVFINNTQTNSDDVTVLNPAQTIPAQITLHTQNNCKAHVSLAATPAGRVSLDQTELDLTDSTPASITITPTAVSQSVNDVTITATVNGKQVGTATMTVVNVTVPSIRATTTPAGVPDRIPPRVDTAIQVTIMPDLGSSGQKITLAKLNNSASNGDFTIAGGATKDLTSTGSVNLRGATQTAPTGGAGGGNAGNLKLVAQVRGQNAVQSNGFSVAAIPQSITEGLIGPVTAPGVFGLRVSVRVDSDSGSNGDLDQCQFSEQIQVQAETGSLVGLGGGLNSGYLTCVGSFSDTHSTGAAHVTGIGTQTLGQAHIFKDLRLGVTNIPIDHSGYSIGRVITQDPPPAGTLHLTTSKTGAAETANGFTSSAGNGGPFSVTQP